MNGEQQTTTLGKVAEAQQELQNTEQVAQPEQQPEQTTVADNN